LYTKLVIAAKKLSEAPVITGTAAGSTDLNRDDLRLQAPITSSYVVQQTWDASTTCGGSPSFSNAIKVGQCYALTNGYGQATVSGNTLIGTTYTDPSCTQGATDVGSAPLNQCSAQAPYSTNFAIVSGTSVPSSYAAGTIATYYGTLANCKAGVGPIYGWDYTASGCVQSPQSSQSVSSTCIGNSQTFNLYSTTGCTGTPVETAVVTAGNQCAATLIDYGLLSIPANGTYISCFTPQVSLQTLFSALRVSKRSPWRLPKS